MSMIKMAMAAAVLAASALLSSTAWAERTSCIISGSTERAAIGESSASLFAFDSEYFTWDACTILRFYSTKPTGICLYVR